MKDAPQGTAVFASARASRTAWLCLAALLMAALALNQGVIDFGFLYLRDDDINVALNPHMGGVTADRLAWMFTDWSYARRYIPLGWLGLCATYGLTGLDPAGFHAVGLAWYILNCGLVYALVLQCLRFFAPGRGLGAWDAGAAALAAAWWALHPMRVETTAWISGNLYGQSLALLLCALIAYMRTYATQGARRGAWLCLAALAYCASLLTYPVGLGAPAILVGLDWLYWRRHPGASFGRLLAEKAAFAVPLAADLAVTLAARFSSTVFGPVPSLAALPLASRIAQSAYVAAYYVWRPWWPLHLSPLYDRLAAFRPSQWPFVLSMAGVAAACVATLLMARRRPALAAAWFIYLAVAAPFFGLTEKPHMTSDRYGSVLMVIAAVVLAAGLARVSTQRARAVASAASLAVIAALGVLSHRQLAIWTDDRVQHAYVVRGLTNPDILDDFSSRQLILEFMRGDEASATATLERRLRADPSSPGLRKAAAIFADKRRISAYYGPVSLLAILQDQMGLAFARRGEFAEANDHLAEALREDDRFYQAAYDRAIVLLRLGRVDDALRCYFLAAGRAPAGLTVAQRRAFLEQLEGVAAATGRPPLARAAALQLAR